MYHPLCALVFICAVLVITMLAFQPVFLLLSFVAACAYNAYYHSPRKVLMHIAWQLPLVCLLAVANMLLSHTGSTVLFTWKYMAFYAESLVYGFAMGIMLVGVFQWFSVASALISSDMIMQVTGRLAPTLGLMITMIMRLIPQYVRRGKQVSAVHDVCTAAFPAEQGGKSKKQVIAQHGRTISVLMGWGMEDSLETSMAMQARGWSAQKNRTSYVRSYFRDSDWVLLAVMLVLLAMCVPCVLIASSQFSFYPTISTLVMWWGYFPYVLFLLVPAALEIREALLWK